MNPVKVKDDLYEFKPFRVPKYKVEFKNANKLTDIAGYQWYTPALLYLWGRFTEVNLADLIAKHNFKIFWYLFDKPIFSGLTFKEDKSWNHLLWACSVDDWKRLVDGILETVQFDIPNQLLFQYALQSFTIPDPLFVDRQRLITANTPTVKISAFAVMSNKHQLAFDLNSGIKGVPQVRTFKAEQIQIDAAEDLFADNNITADKAFEAYKRIMIRLQDQEYQAKVDQIRKTKRR